MLPRIDTVPDTASHTVGIIEDDPIIRRYLGQVIGRSQALRLVGEAGNLPDGRKVLCERPDLLILDLGLEDGSGLDLIGEAADHYPDTRILVLTVFGDETSVMSAIGMGAHGYVLKDSAEDSLIENIFETLKGGSPLSASVAAYLLRHMRERPATVEAGLTQRETELLQLMAKGMSNKEAAIALAISPFTVGDHIKSIYRKLAVRSRTQAVYEAIHRGLIRQ